ncbi:MAG TPA: 3-deoxy-D-manno-octulosonic acid transferase [Geminicoccaceae bacterium]|nr:3-deoxy-D-manno-octulosonic acid transferase [Geminicoccaceae bacterium]
MLLPLYRGATALGAPLVEAHLRRRAGRGKEDPDRLPERLGRSALPRPAGPLVWLHGASVGESLSILPLLNALLDARPDLEALVTTSTVTSAKLMAQRLPAARARHQFAPVDLPAALRPFLAHWRPDLLLLIESELWPNLLLETHARGAPIVLVNARMSPRSFARWRRAPRTAKRLLGCTTLCLAQSEADGERLRALGAPTVDVTGNLKRAAAPLPADPVALAALRAATAGRTVWLAASTHPGEEEQLARVHRGLAERFPGLLTVIAPRHPERGAALAAELRAAGRTLAQRSRNEPVTPATEIYLADTLGELGLFYRLARAAFVGGSLVPHGGQNPLEPARLGCPVLYGPHTHNFAEATALLEARGAACRVGDARDLEATLATLLGDDAAHGRAAGAARAAAESEDGPLRATLAALAPLLARLPASGADARA